MEEIVKQPVDVRQVILAEDDDEDFMVFDLALKEVDLKVILTRAQDGEILIKLLDKNVPDILFLDLHMPCKDGQHCLREIRANKKYDALPIIIYSSLRDLLSIDYCYREGANFYSVKPGSFQDLKAMLTKILTIDWKKFLYYPGRSEFVLTLQ